MTIRYNHGINKERIMTRTPFKNILMLVLLVLGLVLLACNGG